MCAGRDHDKPGLVMLLSMLKKKCPSNSAFTVLIKTWKLKMKWQKKPDVSKDEYLGTGQKITTKQIWQTMNKIYIAFMVNNYLPSF